MAAEIEEVCFNDLRRTFNSWLRNGGEDEGKTAKMMGHHSTTMGRKVYTQWDHDSFATAIEKLPSAALRLVAKEESK